MASARARSLMVRAAVEAVVREVVPDPEIIDPLASRPFASGTYTPLLSTSQLFVIGTLPTTWAVKVAVWVAYQACSAGNGPPVMTGGTGLVEPLMAMMKVVELPPGAVLKNTR